MQTYKSWIILKIVILIIYFILGAFLSEILIGDFSKANWSTFFVLIGFSAFGVFFVVARATKSSFVSENWERPSWQSNPFLGSQPLLSIDFGSYCFLVTGVVGAFYGIRSVPQNWVWGIPLSIGIGMWIGVRLCLSAFSDKIDS